ncbi:MAG: tetratricopeptide repeat protein [Cyanobacteria bacterium P01_F01_bin.150]
MAKRKKKSRQQSTHGFGSKTITPHQLTKKLGRAATYAADKDWDAACSELVTLSQQYPHEKRVWQYLTDTSYEAGNMQLYQHACEQLFAIAPSGAHAYALGGVYLANSYPLLALKTLRQALELDPDHDIAGEVRKTIKTLEPIEQVALDSLGFKGSERVEMAILQEQSQAYLNQGEFAKSRKAEEKVLELCPDFIPAHNNLCLVSWQEANVEGAIAKAQFVLEQDPENIHALSNLIHFLVLSGDGETAIEYKERLKASHADAWDGWTKKAEGLSYLGDDAGVVELWQQAQKEKVDDSPTSALFYHLSAVAFARIGEEKQAIKMWKKALARDSSLTIVQENLKDIRQSVFQRHGAWPFRWEQWLMPASLEQLRKTMRTAQKIKQPGKISARLRTFLEAHPDVETILPRIMERGGPSGQGIFLDMAEQLKTPQLLEIIKVFALGQNGTDRMRNRAANLAVEEKLLPKEKVRLWIRGEWREIMLMAFTFHDEPLEQYSKQVEELLATAISLLQERDKASATEAEVLLKEALELEPDAPDLKNNLALALREQDRTDEFEQLLHEIVEHHPDYVFSRAILAQTYLRDGDIEKANTLLYPLLSRDRFHFVEFGCFACVYIEFLVAKGEKESARSWLQMWEKVYPNDPQLGYWQSRLKKGTRFPKLF